MSTVSVSPHPVRGTLPAPPSKSYTHRALLAGFLSARRYHVHRPNDCDDTRATREGLRALGADFEIRGTGWTIRPEPLSPRRSADIDCRSSGTTLRLLSALAARGSRRVRFRGTAGLAVRPMSGLLESLRAAGAQIEHTVPARSLPFTIRGPIHPGEFVVSGEVSSQYTSALLFVLPTLTGPSAIRVLGTPVSAPYVAATRAVLAAHAVRTEVTSRGFDIPGGQEYLGRQFFVPGDASSAAYLWAAAALTGGQVSVSSLDPKWPQADHLILSILTQMGARVLRRGPQVTVLGPLVTGFDVDLTGAPDLYPLAGTLAAFPPSDGSRLRGAFHARWKESNRPKRTALLARAFGAKVRFHRDTLEIAPGHRPASVRVRGLRDHRLVMSAAVGALALRRPSRIDDARAVEKSYPGFWNALEGLGVEVTGNE
jgi:3-phosphoshikimate 1-carboxyvinyltransferase